MRKLYGIFICLALCAVALTACGSDGEDDASASDLSAQETVAIEKNVNAGVIDKGFGVKEVESVDVKQIEVDGSQGTAEAVLKTKNTLDGQTVLVSLVRADGEWRFFEIEKLINVDKPLLVENYEKELKRPEEKLSPAVIRCLAKEFAAAPQSQVEAMFIDDSEAAFRKLGKLCVKA
jgi:hypothetical protein